MHYTNRRILYFTYYGGYKTMQVFQRRV